MIKITGYLVLILFISYSYHLYGQSGDKSNFVAEANFPYIYAKPEETKWVPDAKFGVFIHWNPASSIRQVSISWGRLGHRAGSANQPTTGVPAEIYDNLYKQFNPVDFDADEWVKTFKASGAGYIIFTTKHHDGFCMFDAKNTEYKITNSPYGKDIARELADACHKHGMKLFWYYSQPDWHHPDYLAKTHDQYLKYMYEQLEQLLTQYGNIDGVWFDQLGRFSSDFDTPRLLKLMRTWQPEILVNDRWGRNMPGIMVRGDYDTPEQTIGVFQVHRPWETCATMDQTWTWSGGKNTKTYETCFRMLIQTAGAGGNLALNIGTKPGGAIFEKGKNNLIKIGNWLSENGESIYGTRGGPYKPGPWGVSTNKGNKVFLHILNKFTEGEVAEIVLPALPKKIISSRNLTGAKVNVIQNEVEVKVQLVKASLIPVDNIVVLELDGSAEDIYPIDTYSYENIKPFVAGNSSSDYSERYSFTSFLNNTDVNIFEGAAHNSYWTAGKNDTEPWIMIDFYRTVSFNYISIQEQIRNCVTREFIIEYEKDGKWWPLYSGQQIGVDFSVKVPWTETSKLRIRFLKWSKGGNPVTISKINVFGI